MWAENSSGKGKKPIDIRIVFILVVIVLPLIAVVLTISISSFFSYLEESNQATAMRYAPLHDEMTTNIQAIKTAQLVYEEMNGAYLAAKAYPRAPSIRPQPWLSIESGGFEKLDWEPVSDVRGSYMIRVTKQDFEIIGVMDVDGDGELATFAATKTLDVYRKTGEGIY